MIGVFVADEWIELPREPGRRRKYKFTSKSEVGADLERLYLHRRVPEDVRTSQQSERYGAPVVLGPLPGPLFVVRCN